jgi:Fic/DOC family
MAEILLGNDEIVFSAGQYDAVSRAARRGELVPLGPGVYTNRTAEEPERVVQRNLHGIVGRLVPDAVVTDRSAYLGGMPQQGQLFIEHATRSRDLKLAGVTVRPRRGRGHHPSDAQLADGLWMSSTPRALLENLRPSRARKALARTLSREDVELWLDRIVRTQGEERLRAYREDARDIAVELGLEPELAKLEPLVGAALGSREVNARTPVLRSRQLGTPFDPDRIVLFERLEHHLAGVAPSDRHYALDDARAQLLPFFEAYFSNFIEGTEFTIAEAARIALEGEIPANRPEDAHDIAGTYQIVSDVTEMRRTPASADELVELLRERHVRLMAGRPAVHPGEFKQLENRACATLFVAPAMVEGTLVEGFARAANLEDPFARAAFMMFLVSEVHPFDDGNGRIARIMMNAELSSTDQPRIIIPTGYRDNYLDALRALSRNQHPAPIERVLSFAQRFVAEMDWSSIHVATDLLSRTNALRDPREGDHAGQRLILPSRISSDAG